MKQKVLIIDDEKDICKLLASTLSTFGYQTKTSQSLTEGKEVFSSYDPDIIFVDIHLPDGNGLNDVPYFRNVKPNIPVIIISAYDSINAMKTAETFGVNAFISKPFNREKISNALQNIPSMQS